MPISAATGAMQKEKRETFSLRTEVEKEYGYIHAMRIGDDLKISGAVSMDDKGILVKSLQRVKMFHMIFANQLCLLVL